MNDSTSTPAQTWKPRFFVILFLWLLSAVAMSFPAVRGIVAYPLVIHEPDAKGEIAYVMADGPAYWERLRAASDLFHQHQVDQIVILQEERSDGFNFKKQRSETRFERSIDFLAMYGIERKFVSGVIQAPFARFGSLSESQGVAQQYPNLKSIVVVTSAPHTRRSKLCFERSLPQEVKISVFSASAPSSSSEIHSPLWIEYVKLVVYFFVA